MLPPALSVQCTMTRPSIPPAISWTGLLFFCGAQMKRRDFEPKPLVRNGYLPPAVVERDQPRATYLTVKRHDLRSGHKVSL
jgi:hypothetical protein